MGLFPRLKILSIHIFLLTVGLWLNTMLTGYTYCLHHFFILIRTRKTMCSISSDKLTDGLHKILGYWLTCLFIYITIVRLVYLCILLHNKFTIECYLSICTYFPLDGFFTVAILPTAPSVWEHRSVTHTQCSCYNQFINHLCIIKSDATVVWFKSLSDYRIFNIFTVTKNLWKKPCTERTLIYCGSSWTLTLQNTSRLLYCLRMLNK